MYVKYDNPFFFFSGAIHSIPILFWVYEMHALRSLYYLFNTLTNTYNYSSLIMNYLKTSSNIYITENTTTTTCTIFYQFNKYTCHFSLQNKLFTFQCINSPWKTIHVKTSFFLVSSRLHYKGSTTLPIWQNNKALLTHCSRSWEPRVVRWSSSKQRFAVSQNLLLTDGQVSL